MTWERKEILHAQYRLGTREKERKTEEKGFFPNRKAFRVCPSNVRLRFFRAKGLRKAPAL